MQQRAVMLRKVLTELGVGFLSEAVSYLCKPLFSFWLKWKRLTLFLLLKIPGHPESEGSGSCRVLREVRPFPQAGLGEEFLSQFCNKCFLKNFVQPVYGEIEKSDEPCKNSTLRAKSIFILLTRISATGFDFPKWLGQDGEGCRQLKAYKILTSRRALQGHSPSWR